GRTPPPAAVAVSRFFPVPPRPGRRHRLCTATGRGDGRGRDQCRARPSPDRPGAARLPVGWDQTRRDLVRSIGPPGGGPAARSGAEAASGDGAGAAGPEPAMNVSRMPPAWRLPEGVDAPLWQYTHTPRLAAEEDAYFAGHPLFQADTRALDDRFRVP